MSKVENAFKNLQILTKKSKNKFTKISKVTEETIEIINSIIELCNSEESLVNSLKIATISYDLCIVINHYIADGALEPSEEFKRRLLIFGNGYDELSATEKTAFMKSWYNGEYEAYLLTLKKDILEVLEKFNNAKNDYNNFVNSIGKERIKNSKFGEELQVFLAGVLYEWLENGLTTEHMIQLIGNIIYLNGLECQKKENENLPISLEERKNYIGLMDYFNSNGTMKTNDDIETFKSLIANFISQNEMSELDLDKHFIANLLSKNTEKQNMLDKKQKAKEYSSKRHAAIAKLKEYYIGGTIIKKCDIETLRTILIDCDFPEIEMNKIIKLMKNYSKDEAVECPLEILTTEEEIKLYQRALKIENNCAVKKIIYDLEIENELYQESDAQNRAEIKMDVEKSLMELKEILDPPKYPNLRKANRIDYF